MTHGHLDRLLMTLGVGIEAFAICEVRRGVRLLFAPVEAIEVHYVLAGTMHAVVPGAEPLICGPGSVVVFPPRSSISVAADANTHTEVVAAEHCSTTRAGMLLCDAADGNAGDLRLLCGDILASFSGSFGLFDYITEPVGEDLSGVEIVRHAFAMMLEEIVNPGPGSRALAGALMKVCLIKVIRGYFDKAGSPSSLFGPLSHPRLGNAVTAVLNQPAAPHSVASLASVAGMSRSAFAREFMEAFAMSPAEFVLKTRLHQAAELLRASSVSVKVIAASVGFASRSYFSHAFRKAYGTDPRSFRNAVTAPETTAPKPLRGQQQRIATKQEPPARG